MASTPIAKLAKTVAEVEVMQGQIAKLAAAVELLTARVEALEKRGSPSATPHER